VVVGCCIGLGYDVGASAGSGAVSGSLSSSRRCLRVMKPVAGSAVQVR
jgi:hypothetical protein